MGGEGKGTREVGVRVKVRVGVREEGSLGK